MNLVLAVVAWNFYVSMRIAGCGFLLQAWERDHRSSSLLVQVNLLLMVFNLIPLGPLDGHYILPYFLPERLARLYRHYNARYGVFALLALIVAGLLGVPVFSGLMSFAASLLPYITFVA